MNGCHQGRAVPPVPHARRGSWRRHFDRRDEVTLYTGNDDHILGDLLVTLPTGLNFRGGLRGQWVVWTHAAVTMFERVRAALATLTAGRSS
jgi:hypothetical protein